MKTFPVIRVVSKLVIPYILLFGFYVQFHGDFGPGGGFQAGVIIATGLILYGLVFGLPAVKRVAPPKIVEKLVAAGLLLYGGTGVLTMLLGGNFLDYDVLDFKTIEKIESTDHATETAEQIDHEQNDDSHVGEHAAEDESHSEHEAHHEELHFFPRGQHLGIFLVELGVGITVTSVMTIIFYCFAGREPNL